MAMCDKQGRFLPNALKYTLSQALRHYFDFLTVFEW